MLHGSFTLGSAALASRLSQPQSGLSITIGALSIQKFVPGSLRTTDKLNSRNTLSLKIVDIDNNIDLRVGELIIVKLNGVRIYAGTLDSVTRIFPLVPKGQKLANIDIRAVDFNQIPDRHLVARNFEIPGQTMGSIARSLVDTELAGEGISTDFVQDGPLITKAIFNYIKVSNAFDELASLTGYYWYVDYFKNLYFVARGDVAAPIGLNDNNCGHLGLSIARSRSQYRNVQFLRAGVDFTDERTESFVGDGERQTFTLQFEVGEIDETSGVTLNAASQTIGLRSINDDGKDWNYKTRDKEISQVDANSGDPLEASDVLAITYKGLFPIIVRGEDLGQIDERKDIEGGTGIYEDADSDENIDSAELAKERVAGILRRDGKLHDKIRFRIDDAGFRAGQLLPINLTDEGIDGDYLISSVTFSDLGTVDESRFRYSVEAVSGEHLGGWVEFFKKLIDKGRPFVIRPNEVLITLNEFFETLNLDETFFNDTLPIDDGKNDPFTGALIRAKTDPVEKWYTIGKANVGRDIYD